MLHHGEPIILVRQVGCSGTDPPFYNVVTLRGRLYGHQLDRGTSYKGDRCPPAKVCGIKCLSIDMPST